MRPLLILLLTVAANGWAEEPAPATTSTTQGSGPTAGERATSASLSADDAWARARAQAQDEHRLRQERAARQSAIVEAGEPLMTTRETIDPGGLATLVEGDEVAVLLELQRRRRNQRDGGSAGNLLAEELAGILAGTPTHLPDQSMTPQEPSIRAHPEDEPHPGPVPPSATDLPDRPDRLPRP
jgi:hypothetical protein